jgi:hypothetical protein
MLGALNDPGQQLGNAGTKTVNAGVPGSKMILHLCLKRAFIKARIIKGHGEGSEIVSARLDSKRRDRR